MINIITSSWSNIILLNTIKDVKANGRELLNELLFIGEDFKSMEMMFYKKFNELIVEYKEITKYLYYGHLAMKAGIEIQKLDQKTILEKRLSTALEQELKFLVLEEILLKIVFEYFLKFYNKYSYPINHRIKVLYERIFKRIQNASEVFEDCKNLPFESLITNVRYRDLHDFRNTLEQKLSINFDIKLYELRNFLYGYDVAFGLKKSHTKYILEYYDIVFDYKRCSSATNVDDFFKNWYPKKELTLDANCIKNSIIKHAFYFDKRRPHFNDEHKEICQRKLSFHKDSINQLEKSCFVIKNDVKKSFRTQHFSKEYQANKLKLTRFRQSYEYINYKSEST